MATVSPGEPTKITKYIQRKSLVTLPKTTGNIVDTLNVEDKITNAPSINLVQMMAGVPEEGVIEFDGDEIPEGYEEVEDYNIYSTEERFTGKYWHNGKKIYNRVMYTTLPNVGEYIFLTLSEYLEDVTFSYQQFRASAGDGRILDIPMPHISGTSKIAGNRIGTEWVVSNDFSDWAGNEFRLEIEYTKTTD